MTESLRKRIVTAVILVVLFLGVLLGLPAWATVIVVTALVLAGAWEWSAFLRPSGTVARVGYVALVAVLLLGARYRPLDRGSAMLSSERISASMPNFAAIAAATSIRLAAKA